MLKPSGPIERQGVADAFSRTVARGLREPLAPAGVPDSRPLRSKTATSGRNTKSHPAAASAQVIDFDCGRNLLLLAARVGEIVNEDVG